MRRTQAALRNTLIELVQQRNLAQISVADVAERAGVGRSTFYAHYRDVHELAEAACTAMIDELIDAIPGHRRAGSPDNLAFFFAHLAEHAGLYRGVLGPQGSARLIDHVRRRATVATYFGSRHPADCLSTGDVRLVTEDVPHSTGDAPHFTGDVLLSTGDTPHDVTAAFTAGALLGVAIDWLQRGCPHPPAEMADLTRPLLMTLYQDRR
ncbi:regulatory protein, tetR family [Nonomuraea solani]|uniref:Regulatory protein, tetR family n=2 Tax=Nonomuraea solani TaxID=1144553 RepID=A0A1H6EVT9_9ACTN|nr:regulatory protein, tetR family [Nonomuraea solani]